MDYKLIGKLARLGVDFAPTAAGMTRSTATGWQKIATNDMGTIKGWLNADGYKSLVAVAKRGRAFMLDIDSPDACIALGWNPEWTTGMFGVNTPSGGQHLYGLQNEAFAELPSYVEIKDGAKLVMEIKVDRCSVAAPTAVRLSQPKKKDGAYVPFTEVNVHLAKGLPAEAWEWVRAHSEKPKTPFNGRIVTDWKFRPEFTVEQFLEDNDCTLYAQGELQEGTFAVVSEACPLCGHDHNGSTVAAGVTKFLFSGTSYGFTCKACGVDTRDEYEEKMAELHADFDPWSQYYIYEHDDPKVRAQQEIELLESMGVESVDSADERPPESTPEPRAEPKTVQPETQPRKTVSPTAGYSYGRHDTGNAERLVRKFGSAIRFIHEKQEWMVYSPSAGWQQDAQGKLMRMTKAVVDELFDEARQMRGDEIDKKAFQHAATSANAYRRQAMIELAGYEKAIHTNIGDWDSDPWLLNVKNGVIELNTQTFRARAPEDLLSKQANVSYDKDATCPNWLKAMEKYGDHDPTWVEWVQQMAGVSLTSYQGLQNVVFNGGGGENGKDAFMATIRGVLGTYAADVKFTTFCERKFGHSEARDDLAALAGAVRFLSSAESSDGHTLDMQAIKLVTGGVESKVTCRELYGKPFSYTPQFHLWFMSNFEPVIKDGDWGTWRRVVKVPWDWDFKTDPEKDPEFAENIRGEYPGILNWALEGLGKFLASDKKLPHCARIMDATAQYKTDMDIIGRFITENVEFKIDRSVGGTAIYQRYVGWCKGNGNYPLQSRRFYAELKKRIAGQATPEDCGHHGFMYHGMWLRPDGPQIEDEHTL
ncbi:MAG: phage/plasmid primase, P4 family [Candidatus Acidiferrales bacterium]